MTELSHLDEQGRARMVDVGDKEETERRARAEALRHDVGRDAGGHRRRRRAQG